MKLNDRSTKSCKIAAFFVLGFVLKTYLEVKESPQVLVFPGLAEIR